jgi:hypothetical protein
MEAEYGISIPQVIRADYQSRQVEIDHRRELPKAEKRSQVEFREKEQAARAQKRERAKAKAEGLPMTADEAKDCVATINRRIGNMVESMRQMEAPIADMLLELRDRKGWKALGYKTWTECATIEFAYSRSRIYQLISAAETRRNLSTIVDKPATIPESQLRVVSDLDPEKQREVFGLALQGTPKEQLTAKVIEGARELVIPPLKPEPAPADPKPALAPEIIEALQIVSRGVQYALGEARTTLQNLIWEYDAHPEEMLGLDIDAVKGALATIQDTLDRAED